MNHGPEVALPLVERLMKAVEYDPDLLARVRQIRDRLKLPMEIVLQRVPGKSVYEKCANIGCARQTYYSWLYGQARPAAPIAKRLSELTGFSAAAIRGRGKAI